ncbi:MAG: sugar nucleotide-binding protein [Verrucomicrobiaceae bacterium]|nr:sugar nucleotide-binding protein [Verrucomicrobiaceae bacterium]
MADTKAYIVVGADSLVGGNLLKALARRGLPAYGTTRRRDRLGPERLFLDFESAEPFSAPADAGYAFVVAAATNYDRCEKDPLARVINEELTPRMIASLLRQGLFVTFISTNSVFGGERAWPHEDAPHDPQIPYAAQKSRAEAVVHAYARELGTEDRLNIVRLTKILDASTSPLPAWFAAWERGEAVEPFSDLIFAPMSATFVGEALATVGEKRVAGHLHLSGAENVSYVDLAQAFARRKNVPADLIRPSSATAKGIHIAFKPRFSGLGMPSTTALTGLRPQSLDEVAADIIR